MAKFFLSSHAQKNFPERTPCVFTVQCAPYSVFFYHIVRWYLGLAKECTIIGPTNLPI